MLLRTYMQGHMIYRSASTIEKHHRMKICPCGVCPDTPQTYDQIREIHEQPRLCTCTLQYCLKIKPVCERTIRRHLKLQLHSRLKRQRDDFDSELKENTFRAQELSSGMSPDSDRVSGSKFKVNYDARDDQFRAQELFSGMSPDSDRDSGSEVAVNYDALEANNPDHPIEVVSVDSQNAEADPAHAEAEPVHQIELNTGTLGIPPGIVDQQTAVADQAPAEAELRHQIDPINEAHDTSPDNIPVAEVRAQNIPTLLTQNNGTHIHRANPIIEYDGDDSDSDDEGEDPNSTNESEFHEHKGYEQANPPEESSIDPSVIAEPFGFEDLPIFEDFNEAEEAEEAGAKESFKWDTQINDGLSTLMFVTLLIAWKDRFKINGTAMKYLFRIIQLALNVKTKILPSFEMSQCKFEPADGSGVEIRHVCRNCEWLYDLHDGLEFCPNPRCTRYERYKYIDQKGKPGTHTHTHTHVQSLLPFPTVDFSQRGLSHRTLAKELF